MTKKLVIVAVIAVLVTAGVIFGGEAIMFHYYWSNPEKRAEWVVKKLTKTLDLNAEQQTKLNKIKDEVFARFEKFKSNRDAVRKEAATLIKSDNLTGEMVNRFFDERKAKLEELRPFIVEKIVEFHNILTPAQRTKLAEKIEKWNQCHHRWHHHLW